MSGLEWQEVCIDIWVEWLETSRRFSMVQVLQFWLSVGLSVHRVREGLDSVGFCLTLAQQLAHFPSAQKMSLLQLFLKSSLRTQITSQSVSDVTPSTAHCFLRRVSFRGAWEF